MKGQIRKLRKEPEVLEEYNEVIKEQLTSGVIESVTELERADKVHYIPTLAVVRKEASTTKVRVVCDASAKLGKGGTSLNDCLHVGPSLNPLLFDILVRFREKRVALVGDIEKAFLNIEVAERDRDCLRFLWCEDVHKPESKIVVYRFCRVVFGLNASPFLLNATLRYHISKYKDEDPEFARKMLEGFHVDDLVTGEKNSSAAFHLYETSKQRMAAGGFRLRKWMTNDKALRDRIERNESNATSARNEEEETFAKVTLGTGAEVSKRCQKVLGLSWDCAKDCIEFSFKKLAYTTLVIRDCHERVLHSGVRATLADMRSRYWVPEGRQCVKKVLRKCVTCKKQEGRAFSAPQTAALPEFRVKQVPAFSKVGVDFAGPLYVKAATGGVRKVYIALFSCCVTRAIHLELV